MLLLTYTASVYDGIASKAMLNNINIRHKTSQQWITMSCVMSKANVAKLDHIPRMTKVTCQQSNESQRNGNNDIH